MLRGPDLDLQIAMVAALSGDADIKSLIGDEPRIYQDVPEGDWPGAYVTIGEGDSTDVSNECGDASEIFPKLHIWSRGKGWTEAKQVAAAVWRVLHDATLTLSENRCFSILHEQTVQMRDPDGTTKHIAMTFAARVEIPAA